MNFLRYTLLLTLATLSLCGQGQTTSVMTSSTPSAALSGFGAPASLYLCNVSSANLQYIQRDATPGSRLWLCDLASDGVTYNWENLKGPIATATTSAIGGTQLLALGCYTTTVNIPSATPGVNAAFAAPLTNPGSNLLFVQAYVSAVGVVSLSVCNLSVGLLTGSSVQYKVLLF